MPAEWHPHHSTWLTWPKDPETWPDRVTQVEEIYLQMIAALTPYEIVDLLVDDEEAERVVRGRCTAAAASRIRFHHIQTVDSWMRDYGPNFLTGPNGEGAFNDWVFNAWGNKYEELKKDDGVPRRLESFLKVKRFSPGIVMEGGSIEVNGAGCVLTTEQCLLNPNRNPHLSSDEIEQFLKDYLNVTTVLWLGEGIVGDDTDGHIDDIARFVAPDVIVLAHEEDPADENHRRSTDNLRRLELVSGANLRVVTLPYPRPVYMNGERLPASYANFYIANGVVIVPTFNDRNDREALNTLASLMPDREVVGIHAVDLVWGLGTLHCLTQQQARSQP